MINGSSAFVKVAADGLRVRCEEGAEAQKGEEERSHGEGCVVVMRTPTREEGRGSKHRWSAGGRTSPYETVQ